MRRPLLTLLAALALAAGCSGERQPRVAPGTPLVLISIDTLRSDHLPAYGYSGVETPAIDGLARDGIVFERAYTHAPTTLPAHTSLLTGLLPPEHGVRDNAGYRLVPGAIPTLADALREAGYATGAAVSSFVLRRSTGLAAGFDSYEDGIEYSPRTGIGGLERPGAETVRLALNWVRAQGERPWFLFVHLFEPHFPYAPPEPFASRYDNAYDGEIAAADAAVGELLDELRRSGDYRRALVVLLSDHGEGLGDHGEQEHGVLLYREALQVPLILKLPQAERAGARVVSPAQLIDVYPTLTQLLGLSTPAGLEGVSLIDLVDQRPAERGIYAETFYPRLHFGWSELASLISDRLHYIEGPDPELFDLIDDPREVRNLVTRDPATQAELSGRLAEIDRGLAPQEPLDAETRRKLAALGYVGSGSAAASAEGGRDDPKQHLPLLEALRAAVAEFSRGEFARSAVAFRKIVDAYPAMLDGWDYLARSYLALGQREQALAAYREGMRASEGAELLALPLATLLFGMHQLDEAQAHAELAVDVDPPAAYTLLSQVAERRGELERAEELARRAVELGDSRFGPQLALASVQLARGEYEDGLATLDRVEQAFEARNDPDPEAIRGLYFLRGQILANLGRPAEAETAFHREIQSFPGDLRNYSHLAAFYAMLGRREEAVGTLRLMLETQPRPEAYAEAASTLRALGDEQSAAKLEAAARARWEKK